MTSMLLATIVQTAILATGADATLVSHETYAEARQVTTETGKPMVVMVSTDWCPPCQTMKRSVLPRVRELGLLRKVAFAIVNPDRDKDLAQELTGGGPIPQLVMYRKTPNGWTRQKLVGGQSVESVQQFISEGLAQDEDEKKSAAPKQEKYDSNGTSSEKTANDAQHG
jgi:thioredoxin-like negative regulator of GroEL